MKSSGGATHIESQDKFLDWIKIKFRVVNSEHGLRLVIKWTAFAYKVKNDKCDLMFCYWTQNGLLKSRTSRHFVLKILSNRPYQPANITLLSAVFLARFSYISRESFLQIVVSRTLYEYLSSQSLKLAKNFYKTVWFENRSTVTQTLISRVAKI